MKNLLQIFLVLGVVASAFVAVALGLTRHDVELLSPTHLIVFAIASAIYLLPTGLALYRSCSATVWIGVLNVFLGWTIFGWVVAIGWAASGKVRVLSAATPPPGLAVG